MGLIHYGCVYDTSINGGHFGENLVLSGLPNVLHSMAAAKLWGREIDAVEHTRFVLFYLALIIRPSPGDICWVLILFGKLLKELFVIDHLWL